MKYIPKNTKGEKFHPSIPASGDKSPYIYFLLKSGKIVYVGETIRIRKRIYQHNHYVDYDTIRIMSCHVDRLVHYEQRWIMKFQPSLNIQHTERRGNGRKYKTTFGAMYTRKYVSENRDKINRKHKYRQRQKRKPEKVIKMEKLKAMVSAGFSVEYASQKLGIRLASASVTI